MILWLAVSAGPKGGEGEGMQCSHTSFSLSSKASAASVFTDFSVAKVEPELKGPF